MVLDVGVCEREMSRRYTGNRNGLAQENNGSDKKR